MAEIKGTLERRKTSKWWYGRYKIDGQRKAVNLHIEIRGDAPEAGEERGSDHFEKSKIRAEEALRLHLKEINSDKSDEELAQAVHKAKTGRKAESPKLTDLPQKWEKIPRGKPVTENHKNKSIGWINGFIEWMGKHHPEIKELNRVSEQIALEFMGWHEQRGITPRTWNAILSTMKTACRRGGCPAFSEIRQKPADTIHRIPFTPEELQSILKAAKMDKLVYPLVVTATCTAMRKGDCCRLKWEHVDLKSGFIAVKTSKTGRSVDIPLADLLRTEIEKQIGNGSQFVFPELAERYAPDETYLTKRFKKILAAAGFHDGKPPPATIAPYDADELATKAEDYFNSIPTDQKRNKARAMFKHYTEGKRLCDSAKLVGISKGTASLYLNEIENATGIAFIRGKQRDASALPPSRGDVRQKRETGIRRASVRDLHSLRTTWITLALMQGMPLELVKTVTGHATAEIIMEHYFKPQREQLREAMQKALPGMLSSSSKAFTPADRAAEVLRNADPDNLQAAIDEALKILEGNAS